MCKIWEVKAERIITLLSNYKESITNVSKLYYFYKLVWMSLLQVAGWLLNLMTHGAQERWEDRNTNPEGELLLFFAYVSVDVLGAIELETLLYRDGDWWRFNGPSMPTYYIFIFYIYLYINVFIYLLWYFIYWCIRYQQVLGMCLSMKEFYFLLCIYYTESYIHLV